MAVPITLYFNNYRDVQTAVNALAVEANVKMVRRANGDEEITFTDGTRIQFRTVTRKCRCNHGG